MGEPEPALDFTTRGMQLNPYYTWHYPYNQGRAYYTLGRYNEAILSLSGRWKSMKTRCRQGCFWR